MFETDDDFDLDEVLLNSVSIIEEEAIKAVNLAIIDTQKSKTSDTQKSIPNDDSLRTSFKTTVKRKSDTEADINTQPQKKLSEECLRLLESINSPQALPVPASPNIHASISESRKPSATKFESPKPPTVWKMKAEGNTSGCEMRTIQAACHRKFPGPAGLLPERANRVSYVSNESGIPVALSQAEIPVCSQPTQTLDVGPWQALRYDLQDAQDLLDKYTVSWVKQRVATRRLPGQKIPFLAAVLHNVDASSQDPVIVLRDKTGLINGTIHRSVWECHGGQLVQGSALILRLVGVACTGTATQQRLYVNVTSNNIVTIYSPSPSDEDVNVTEVHPLDIPEIRQRIKEWEEKSKAEAAAAAAANASGQNSTLFSSVLDRTPLRQIAPPSPGLSTGLPRPTNLTRNPPQQRTINNIITPRGNSPNSGNSRNLPSVSKSSNSINRVQLNKPSNLLDQNKIVTSTQTGDAEKMSVDVSTFLEGLDTDLLFDDF